MRLFLASFLALTALLLTARPVRADDSPIAPEDLRAQALAADGAVPPGWKNTLSLGATFSFNQSDQVVGSPDGISLQLGVLVDGQTAYTNGRHTWTSTLKGAYSESKTPLVDHFLKSADNLDLTTTYTLRLETVRWIGPYVRARLSTQVAPGYLVRPTAYTVNWKNSDGTVSKENYAAQEFTKTTGSFDPLVLGESVGMFANPTESEAVTVKLKLGVGSQQVISTWGYSVTENSDTHEFDAKQVQTALQAGAEAEAQAYGQATEALKWKAKASFFMPFFTSIGGTPTGIDALNTDLTASASYKLAKWLSLDYVFSVKRVPLVSDKWQVQNGAVLTAGFNL